MLLIITAAPPSGNTTTRFLCGALQETDADWMNPVATCEPSSVIGWLLHWQDDFPVAPAEQASIIYSQISWST